MPNYYNFNKNNELPKARKAQLDNQYPYNEAKKYNRERVSDDLIIDDNSVYEIDQDCFERVKQARLNQKQDWNKK